MIVHMTDMDKQVFAVSKDIKKQIQPFYQKIEESSNLNSEVYRKYDLFCSVTHRLPFALLRMRSHCYRYSSWLVIYSTVKFKRLDCPSWFLKLKLLLAKAIKVLEGSPCFPTNKIFSLYPFS